MYVPVTYKYILLYSLLCIFVTYEYVYFHIVTFIYMYILLISVYFLYIYDFYSDT